ncbi:hypothetical protein ACJX0J_013991, partial [Zea mays]
MCVKLSLHKMRRMKIRETLQRTNSTVFFIRIPNNLLLLWWISEACYSPQSKCGLGEAWHVKIDSTGIFLTQNLLWTLFKHNQLLLHILKEVQIKLLRCIKSHYNQVTEHPTGHYLKHMLAVVVMSTVYQLFILIVTTFKLGYARSSQSLEASWMIHVRFTIHILGQGINCLQLCQSSWARLEEIYIQALGMQPRCLFLQQLVAYPDLGHCAVPVLRDVHLPFTHFMLCDT